ncbi:TPA: ROK family protein, partial [Streptococcus suis]|nr:ROK family protein [Streptococcus suis]
LFHPESSPEQFLFIHIGPGLFCSFFDSEHILQNKNFYIGEIGHTVVDLNGPSCECGKRGCLQTYISDTWLINNARFLFENVQGSIIKTLVEKPEDITLDVVYNAYRLGDGFIIEKIESGIDFLATSIANTLVIYDSKKIFINS